MYSLISHLGLSENVVYPKKSNGFADHYPCEKWLFHWGYTPFSLITHLKMAEKSPLLTIQRCVPIETRGSHCSHSSTRWMPDVFHPLILN